MSKLLRDITSQPYYDTTNQEILKGYTSVLFPAGRTLQNRELNVLNGHLLNHVKNIGDIMLTSGTIVSGCSFTNDSATNKCYLSSGKVYLNGIVCDVPEASWDINDLKDGTLYLCLDIRKLVVNEIDDPMLYDPAEHYENYEEPGAHRVKYDLIPIILTMDEFNKAKIGNRDIIDILLLFNKQLVGPTKLPEFGKIYTQLDGRTFDELGNFLVRGFHLRVEPNPSSTLLYNIEITPGKAYVKGKELNNNAVSIPMDSAIDVRRSSVDEIKRYRDDAELFRLNNRNVNEIFKVQVRVREEINMTKSNSPIDRVPIQYNPVYEIYSITQGGIEYLRDVDWYQKGSNAIIWISANRPGIGTTYNTELSYSKLFTQGVDYTLVRDVDNRFYINFLGTNGFPEDNSEFLVDYSWFLSRFDLVYLDSDGIFKVNKGAAGEDYEIAIPPIPTGTLPISYIKVIPGVSARNFPIRHYNIYRLTVSEMIDMRKRLDTVEYNVAMNELEKLALRKHEQDDFTLGNLRGIYVDGFDDFSRADIFHPSYDCNIDIFSKTLKLPGVSEIYSYNSELYKLEENIEETNAYNNNGFICNHFTTSEIDWQRNASDTINLNPFGIFPIRPELKVEPRVLISVDSTDPRGRFISIPVLTNLSEKTINDWIRTNITEIDVDIVNSIQLNQLRKMPELRIPRIEVIVKGKNFEPNSDIRVLFDDKEVYVEPTGMGNINGSVYGTIRTTSRGDFEGTFTIPNGIFEGEKIVSAFDINKLENGTDFIFSAMSITEEIERILYAEQERLRGVRIPYPLVESPRRSETSHRGSSRRVDPVAQSFWFDESIFLTGIDLYFAQVPQISESHYFYFSIRELSAGLPVGPIIYSQLVEKESIKVSPNANLSTNIEFDYPIYCAPNREYAFCVGCDDTGYKLWYSKLNRIDVLSGADIASQTHKGNMFVSSNNVSWSVWQDSNLAFTLYRANFAEESKFTLKSIQPNMDRFSIFNLIGSITTFLGTSYICNYRINKGVKRGFPLSEKIEIPYDSPYTDDMEIEIEFLLETENDKVSTFINLNTLTLLLSQYKYEGNYIMRSLPLEI